MTTEAERTPGGWHDRAYINDWMRNDGPRGLLELPWRIAGAVSGMIAPPSLVIDIGSGPGHFLATFLDRFPAAQGVWVDMSTAMREQAQVELGRFAGRVRFVIGDAERLADVDLPRNADVVTNSRVAHHFDPEGLARFYQAAKGLLAENGWMVTLDHIRPVPEWDRRYRTIVPQFAGPGAGKPTHEHKYPFPTVQEHLTAMGAVGFAEPELVWKSMYTALFLARRPGPGD
jgi:SAM-dependent methyltransferase